MKDWNDILKTCDLQNWKEALAAVMTYAQPEEFSSLCGLLKEFFRRSLLAFNILNHVMKLLSSIVFRPARGQT